ncbi:MAG: T9SS C-terminal target domain-containing protein [Ignavibacteriae bacterium]|nr:MAG: T9SS C-terminal target domain-containing protein [Ignavibacteriota bacterium]
MTNKLAKYAEKTVKPADNIYAGAEGLIEKIQKIIQKDNIMPIEIESSNSFEQSHYKSFSPIILIKYEIPSRSFVTLIIYDSRGREVTSLINEIKDPGKHEIKWNSLNQSSGVYFYKLIAGDYRETKRMILIK